MNKRDTKLLSIFSNLTSNKKIIDSTIKIQNNINIYANSKAIAVVAAKDDVSSDIVARTIAEVYAFQNQSTLLIDCDMYNHSLNKMYNKEFVEMGLNNILDDKFDVEKLVNKISNNLDIIFTNNDNYPTKVFKSKQYIEFVCNAKEKYEHVIFLMPSIVEHQDILLNKKLITATLLIARKNKVSKKDLFDSIQVLKANDIPYVGTIYLK